MNGTRHILKSNSGTALITGMIVMLMVAMLGIAYISLTSTNLLQSQKDTNRATAFHLAEAGIEYAIDYETNLAESNGGVMTNWTYDSTSLLDSMKSGATGSIRVVKDGGSSSTGIITSSATYKGSTETVTVTVRLKDLGIWNNAIFAGIGQSGRGINGNVDIRGSVHILGDGEPFTDLNGNGVWNAAEPYTDSNGNGVYDIGEPFTDTDGNGVRSSAEPYVDINSNGMYDPPLTATDLATTLSGTANIGSNYNGIPADLSTKIPALVPQTYGGESVYTLNSELRVKHGKVNLSGTATVGDPNIIGNLVKETVDGVFVNDGYGGNQGVGNIYSDNGYSNRYDLGDRVDFPYLTGVEYTDPNTGVNYSNYSDFLDAMSMNLSASVTSITPTTPAFSYSSGTNSISWNPTTKTMTINGLVKVGNLDMSVKGGTIYFSGTGTIYSTGSVSVHGSVMPSTMFPTTDSIGVIAKNDINLATGGGESQINAMGAWYAGGTIRSAKQSQFAGTFVADYFDMGTNVPSIYQVPTLSTNLPPFMPGADVHIVVISVNTWNRTSGNQ